MGCVSNLSEARRKREIEGLLAQIERWYGAAADIASEYAALMEKDPAAATLRVGEFIGKARNANPGQVEALVGGPNHDWIIPVINICGASYPYLDREVRKGGLAQVMRFLDGLNYFRSQDHVEGLHEPWLVADIIVSSGWLYWPGYKHETDILAEARTWKELAPKIPDARSQFWLAYTVMKPQWSSLEVRTRFYKEFPELTDRTLDAVAAIVESESRSEHERKGVDLAAATAEHLNHYDPLLHEAIRTKVQEEKWIKLDF